MNKKLNYHQRAFNIILLTIVVLFMHSNIIYMMGWVWYLGVVIPCALLLFLYFYILNKLSDKDADKDKDKNG